MLHIFAKQYDPGEGSSIEFITSPLSGVIEMPALIDGDIEKITILGELQGSSDYAKFQVYLNGAPQFADGARPTLNYGDAEIETSGLSITVAEYDRLRLDMPVVSGTIMSNITVIFFIEDGVSLGGVTDLEGLSDVDLTTPATNDILKYNGSQWVNVPIPASGATDLEGLSDVDLTSPAAGQLMRYNGSQWVNVNGDECIAVACSDQSTSITTGTAKVTFRMPYAFTLSDVRASVNTAPTGSTIVIDINETGTTILSTKLSIDASEKTSTTAATPPVISDTSLADDAEITIDFDQVGSTIPGKGVMVYLIGHRT